MKLIETKTLPSAAASIEFTSIPQTFTDLLILVSGRQLSGSVDGFFEFNNSASDYSARTLVGIPVTPTVVSGTQTQLRFVLPESGMTANTFGNTSIYVPNYTSATNKSVSTDTVMENNGAAGNLGIFAHLWSDTAAITSVEFGVLSSGEYVTGSTISLYGILKGSDGIVTTS